MSEMSFLTTKSMSCVTEREDEKGCVATFSIQECQGGVGLEPLQGSWGEDSEGQRSLPRVSWEGLSPFLESWLSFGPQETLSEKARSPALWSPAQ